MASVPAIIYKLSSYKRSCWVQAYVASVERGGNWDTENGERRGGLGKRVPFSFSRFSSSASPGAFLRQPYRLLMFVQYSFTAYNKVAVTENIGSVLRFHLKDIENTADQCLRLTTMHQ